MARKSIIHMNYLVIFLQPVLMMYYVLLITTTTCCSQQLSNSSQPPAASTRPPVTKGFRFEMIHPVSSKYPLHSGTNLTKSERIKRFFNSSTTAEARLAALTSAQTGNPNLPLVADSTSSYMVVVSMGTPAKTQYMVMDTGSHIFWVACAPCDSCHKDTETIYDPKKSSTYLDYTCLSDYSCPGQSNCLGDRCVYEINYKDTSYSKGELEWETFSTTDPEGNVVELLPRKLMFGCSHEVRLPTMKSNRWTGIMGMSWDELSFVSQVGGEGARFSYCLFDPIKYPDDRTYLSLGDQDDAGSHYYQWTPLTHGLTSHYYLNLMAISVNGERFDATSQESGPCIIDSGASFSAISSSLFVHVKEAMQRYFHNQGADPLVNDPRCPRIFDLCFEEPSDDWGLDFPQIIFHFEGADFVLPKENAFYSQERVHFFVMRDANAQYTLFGAWQQHDFKILHDLSQKRLYFVEEDCNELWYPGS